MPKKGLLLVTMEPPASMEDEFNDWYDTEHFPQRAGLPGFESASRWVCVEGWPRWLALYDLANVAAVETQAYRAVSGASSTPWSKRVLARAIGRMRLVAEQVAPGDALALPPGRTARLLLARYADAAPERLAAGYASAPGLAQLRLFAAEPGAVWAIAAFDRPVSFGRLIDAAGQVGGTPATWFNLYAPYWPLVPAG